MSSRKIAKIAKLMLPCFRWVSRGRFLISGLQACRYLLRRQKMPGLEAKNSRVDIAIIVPKEDELRSLEWAFGADFTRRDGELPGGKLYYRHKVGTETQVGFLEVSVAIIFLNSQGNSITSSVTEQILSQLDPSLIFLVGTAAGKQGKVKIGDVVVSEQVEDVQEWRIEQKELPRTKQHPIQEKIHTDVSRFIGKTLSLMDLRRELLSVPKSLYRNMRVPNELWESPPNVQVKFVASGPDLLLNPDKLSVIWSLDDRIRCYEMEGAGFATVCRQYLGKQWLVVRGVSDYGTPESRKDEYRVAATASAAKFLQMFIRKGLIECHPNSVRVPESEEYVLSPESIYSKISREDIMFVIKKEVKEQLSINLEGIDFGRSLSLSDVESLCVSRGADRKKAYDILTRVREDYFTKKYVQYDYEHDLRGLVPNWANEIKEILSRFSIQLNSSTVVDVGIGNGLEAPYLFTEAREIYGVDISNEMLARARKNFHKLEIYSNSAENMESIGTGSKDVYISLRTYQSTLFDIHSALREAQRVLKQRGIIIVSIANGFVKSEAGQKKVIRGLLVPGSRDIVDKSAPMRLSLQIWEKLTNFGFELVGLKSESTDIYVWGQKP
jgi:nucleoside phosphorylase/SAM-dependent methyltransferase